MANFQENQPHFPNISRQNYVKFEVQLSFSISQNIQKFFLENIFYSFHFSEKINAKKLEKFRQIFQQNALRLPLHALPRLQPAGGRARPAPVQPAGCPARH